MVYQNKWIRLTIGSKGKSLKKKVILVITWDLMNAKIKENHALTGIRWFIIVYGLFCHKKLTY